MSRVPKIAILEADNSFYRTVIDGVFVSIHVKSPKEITTLPPRNQSFKAHPVIFSDDDLGVQSYPQHGI